MTREEYLKRKIYLKQQYIDIIRDDIKLLRTELAQCQGPAPNKADPHPPAIEIPVVSGEKFPVFGEDVNEWAVAFPGVDVLAELKIMVEWCKSNPRKQKTLKGTRRFITSWLGRAQNSPRRNIPPNAPIDQRPAVFPKRGIGA